MHTRIEAAASTGAFSQPAALIAMRFDILMIFRIFVDTGYFESSYFSRIWTTMILAMRAL